MLKQRIVTAIVLITVILLILFLMPTRGIYLLSFLIYLISAWEWSAFLSLKNSYYRGLYLLILFLVFLGSTQLPWLWIVALGALWWLQMIYWIIRYPQGKQLWLQGTISTSIAGYFLLIPCWLGILSLFQNDEGHIRFLYLLILIWSADIFAYFVGKKLGKRKLIPHVSPGKTIEGVLGGWFGTCLVGIILSFIMEVAYFPYWKIILIATTITFFSLVGDLLVSLVKRIHQVKDTGNILPGHGGILDRIDSITAAVPAFVILLNWIS